MEERAIYVDIDPNDIHDAEPELLFDSHYRAKQIMLDYGTEPLIKAGSPISASGKVSNNASAIGILKRDCYRHLTSVGDVIIGGYIKSDVAQDHSGIKISDAARAAMSRLAFIGADGVPDGHPQSDWNQNDDTQPDYVKNRPFYTGDPVETVFVEESTVTFAEHNGAYVANIQSTVSATVGETYTVYWDGTAYECTCVSFQGMSAIGNLSIAGAGSDTGEPFVMMIEDGNYIEIGTTDTSASHTFSISQYSAGEVVKIDKRFMPEDLYGLFHFKIVVDAVNATYTADKPYADILSALKEGKPVVCGDNFGYQYLASLSGNYVHLTRVDLALESDNKASFEIIKVYLNESGGMSSKTYRSESILTLVDQIS